MGSTNSPGRTGEAALEKRTGSSRTRLDGRVGQKGRRTDTRVESEKGLINFTRCVTESILGGKVREKRTSDHTIKTASLR